MALSDPIHLHGDAAKAFLRDLRNPPKDPKRDAFIAAAEKKFGNKKPNQ